MGDLPPLHGLRALRANLPSFVFFRVKFVVTIDFVFLVSLVSLVVDPPCISRSPFDKRLQCRQRAIPLFGDLLEIGL